MKERVKQFKKIPPALQDKPYLHDFLLPYYTAFNELNARRQYSMAELPLQASEIEVYARLFHFMPDMRFFYRAMVEMDSEYLIYMAEKRETEAEQKKSKP